MTSNTRLLCAIYIAIATAALIATWSQNLAFFGIPDNGGMAGFIRAAFANPAAASIGYDILFVALAAVVWMWMEARRLQIPFVWVYIALSFAIAVSVMFPLFLAAREIKLSRMHAAV